MWKPRSPVEDICDFFQQPQRVKARQQAVAGRDEKSGPPPPRVLRRRVAIVGNGPVAEEQRPEIESCDVVVRFNALHSW